MCKDKNALPEVSCKFSTRLRYFQTKIPQYYRNTTQRYSAPPLSHIPEINSCMHNQVCVRLKRNVINGTCGVVNAMCESRAWMCHVCL